MYNTYVYKPTRCTKFLWLDCIFHWMLYMFRTILVHHQEQLYKLYIAFGIWRYMPVPYVWLLCGNSHTTARCVGILCILLVHTHIHMLCFLTSDAGVAEVPVVFHDLKYFQCVIRDSNIQISPASYSPIRKTKQSQYVTWPLASKHLRVSAWIIRQSISIE